jgi:hypothetical protein
MTKPSPLTFVLKKDALLGNHPLVVSDKLNDKFHNYKVAMMIKTTVPVSKELKDKANDKDLKAKAVIQKLYSTLPTYYQGLDESKTDENGVNIKQRIKQIVKQYNQDPSHTIHEDDLIFLRNNGFQDAQSVLEDPVFNKSN